MQILGIIDTDELSKSILHHLAGREETKAKLKISIAGCSLCCSGTITSDIGSMATRK